MKHHLTAIAALALGAFALPAAAQSMKPGLWEITSSMSSPHGELQSAMAEMQKALAEMEPEQRKQMEAMMAKQGMQLGGGAAGGGMRAKMCITPEMAKRGDLPVQQEGECTHAHSKVGGKTKFSFNCKNPRSTGEGEVAYTGDTAYKMKMKVSGDARDDVMLMDASGKWLGADCGNIKPIALPKAK